MPWPTRTSSRPPSNSRVANLQRVGRAIRNLPAANAVNEAGGSAYEQIAQFVTSGKKESWVEEIEKIDLDQE